MNQPPDDGWQEWFAALDADMPRAWHPEREAAAPFARWAQPSEIRTGAWRWSDGDPSLLLGRYDQTLIGRRDDDRHFVTIAGTRAGKGRSLIVPNLLIWPGSVIAIDPKGELAKKTARYRKEGLGQEVLVLDPFGVSGWRTMSYNPIDDLDRDSPTFMDDVALLADALIVNETSDRHWTQAAKNLVRSLIFYMLATGGEATLTRMRLMLLGNEGRLAHPPNASANKNDFLFCRMAECPAFDGYVSLLGKSFLDKTDRELDSIISVAREQLAFLDSNVMPPVLRSSGFRLASVRDQPTTIYLCLPAGRLATHFRWLRIFVNLAMASLESNASKPNPVLLLLEEFATLGHMEAIEKAAGQIAGFGVKLWAVLQDLGQLKAIYRERWETFLGNAGVTTWFGLNDLTSLEYVSKRLGDTHFIRKDKTNITMDQRGHGAAEYRESVVNTKLLSPEEVGRFLARETGRLLVLHPGSRPMILRRLDESDAMFEGKVDDEHG